MTVPRPKYPYIDAETRHRILDLIEWRPEDLTDFEKNLINDRFAAIQQFYERAVASPKQLKKINTIWEKHMLRQRVKNLKPL